LHNNGSANLRGGHVPGEPELAGCPLNFPSPFFPRLCISRDRPNLFISCEIHIFISVWFRFSFLEKLWFGSERVWFSSVKKCGSVQILVICYLC